MTGLALVAVLLLGGEWAIDAAFHPWAHAVLGSATFTGEWSGTFVDVHGKKQTALLTLRRTLTPAGYFEDDASPLSGELTVAGSTRHTVSGRPEWWRGRRVRLLLDVTAPAAPRGYLLREADAVWDGNSLALRTRLAYYDETGGRFASGARLPLLSREVSINLVTRAQAAE
jgi:hypothetical protein